jgi:hypothetical protein
MNYHTDDNRVVYVAGWSGGAAQATAAPPPDGACGNGHVGPVGTTCTQDGCGKLIVNTH